MYCWSRLESNLTSPTLPGKLSPVWPPPQPPSEAPPPLPTDSPPEEDPVEEEKPKSCAKYTEEGNFITNCLPTRIFYMKYTGFSFYKY